MRTAASPSKNLAYILLFICFSLAVVDVLLALLLKAHFWSFLVLMIIPSSFAVVILFQNLRGKAPQIRDKMTNSCHFLDLLGLSVIILLALQVTAESELVFASHLLVERGSSQAARNIVGLFLFYAGYVLSIVIVILGVYSFKQLYQKITFLQVATV